MIQMAHSLVRRSSGWKGHHWVELGVRIGSYACVNVNVTVVVGNGSFVLGDVVRVAVEDGIDNAAAVVVVAAAAALVAAARAAGVGNTSCSW